MFCHPTPSTDKSGFLQHSQYPLRYIILDFHIVYMHIPIAYPCVVLWHWVIGQVTMIQPNINTVVRRHRTLGLILLLLDGEQQNAVLYTCY